MTAPPLLPIQGRKFKDNALASLTWLINGNRDVKGLIFPYRV